MQKWFALILTSATKKDGIAIYFASMGRMIRIELTNAWFTARCVNPFTTSAITAVYIIRERHSFVKKNQDFYRLESNFLI